MTCRRSNTSHQKSRARFQRLKEARKMKVRQLEEDLAKAKKENKNLQEKFEEGLEEGVCQLIAHTVRLESSKGRAEAAFEEAKQVLCEECNIILSNVSTLDPSVEEVD
ncbi:hypothetical protein RhiirC2_799468 [Rhizophagus irregularis]|uniref:Uncharacterized protein n=1 Tax=Rhizophagus irregularis TaxID=588596 RepID=A0A2N1M503_9GLOM|nr:hypothetical protein RhiirC2_799468 [Rhizophagus irregularis]